MHHISTSGLCGKDLKTAHILESYLRIRREYGSDSRQRSRVDAYGNQTTASPLIRYC